MLDKSKMQFLGYSVTKLHYEDVESEKNEFSINPQFKRTIKEIDASNYLVEIELLLKPSEAEPLPFQIEMAIAGKFVVESDDAEFKKQLIEKNTLAILFPYIRSTLSSLTLLANIPPLIMPIFDFTKVFSEDEKTSD